MFPVLFRCQTVGATICNILTGAFPYPFTKERDPIDGLVSDDIVTIGQRDKTIPKNLCAVPDKALEKKSGDRYQTAAEILAAMKKRCFDFRTPRHRSSSQRAANRPVVGLAESWQAGKMSEKKTA